MSDQRIDGGPEDNDIDEIVLHNVDVHIERMTDGQVWMAFYRKDAGMDRLVFWMTAERRDDLRTSAYWDGTPWPDVRNASKRWEPEFRPKEYDFDGETFVEAGGSE